MSLAGSRITIECFRPTEPEPRFFVVCVVGPLGLESDVELLHGDLRFQFADLFADYPCCDIADAVFADQE